MFQQFLKTSFKISFVVFVLSISFSLVAGLYALWNPSEFSGWLIQAIATGTMLLFASLFYMATCDVWFRLESRQQDRSADKLD